MSPSNKGDGFATKPFQAVELRLGSGGGGSFSVLPALHLYNNN